MAEIIGLYYSPGREHLMCQWAELQLGKLDQSSGKLLTGEMAAFPDPGSVIFQAIEQKGICLKLIAPIAVAVDDFFSYPLKTLLCHHGHFPVLMYVQIRPFRVSEAF